MQGAVYVRNTSIILDMKGVVLRVGQHSAWLLMVHLGLNPACCGILNVDSTNTEVGVLINTLKLSRDVFA